MPPVGDHQDRKLLANRCCPSKSATIGLKANARLGGPTAQVDRGQQRRARGPHSFRARRASRMMPCCAQMSAFANTGYAVAYGRGNYVPLSDLIRSGVQTLLQGRAIDRPFPSRDHDGSQRVAKDVDRDKCRRHQAMNAQDDSNGGDRYGICCR
jgi:hypothetical protein